MLIEVLTRSEEDLEDYDYRDRLEIKVDGKSVIDVHDGEPEDNTLGRNFSGCYAIADLLKQAYEAGCRGEVFEINQKNF